MIRRVVCPFMSRGSCIPAYGLTANSWRRVISIRSANENNMNVTGRTDQTYYELCGPVYPIEA